MNHTLVTILLAILPLAAAAATGLLGKAAQYALHATASIKDQNVRDSVDWAITTAEHIADAVVIAPNETLVNGLKASGQWTATTASAAKTAALNAMAAQLPAAAHDALARAIADLPGYLDTLIEAAVATAPNKIPATKPAMPA
jgi:hypothetical protein